jgi:hypothetical protein
MKQYCKTCQYCIKYNHKVFGTFVKQKDQGLEICGAVMGTEKNCVGDTVWKRYGTDSHCESCGAQTSAKDNVIYKLCIDRNRGFKCNDYKPKWWAWILRRFI